MKARVLIKVNKRLWPSTGNKPLRRPLRPNDIIEVAEEVVGEEYRSNNIWYKTNEGYYIWSGAARDISSDPQIVVVADDTFNRDELSSYWNTRIGDLSLRPELFTAIGCIKVAGTNTQATGFLVKPGLILTCKHVVRVFAETHSDPKKWKIKPGTSVEINFQWEDGNEGPGCPVTGIPLVHADANFDLALLQYSPTNNQQHILEILPDSEVPTPDEPMAIIGYPVENFNGRKKLSTASLTKIYSATLAYQTIVRQGNSGSPVLNSLGQVVGIHKAAETFGGSLQTYGFNYKSINNFLK